MNILYAASEAAPFVKTGGLADVAGSLPQALAARGHDVRVVLPLYEGMDPQWREKLHFLFHFQLTLAWRNLYCGVFQLEKDGVTWYFIDNEYYFKRRRLYGHFDDAERFGYFSRAVIELAGHLDWYPDLLHCNDWQTALVPVYLLEARRRVPQLGRTRSVFTIHNIEYQGRYSRDCLEDVFGLSQDYFSQNMLEYYGDVNLLKGGVYAADYVTTVSPTYAQELRYPFYAHGLEGVIAHCGHKLRGILNGLDTALYDPSTDPTLPARYSAEDLSGKALCKQALQRSAGLNEDPAVPVVGCVSRLAEHKGFDLMTAVLHDIMGMGVQVVILGTGDVKFEEAFRRAAAQYPGRFSAQLTYSADLAGKIYSGCDIFLMPSLAEPCGLSQMIAMRYGALPLARETGGLKDTVIPAGMPGARGFTFANINAHDMAHVLWQAVQMYREEPETWHAMQKNAMTADFGWAASAQAYLELYRQLAGM